MPISEIRQMFYRLYNNSLSYFPIFSSTPFYKALSWADCYTRFPEWLQITPNPALLIKHLLNDERLLVRFIFYSFLPKRFNGAGFGRYPEQLLQIQSWLSRRRNIPLRLLDAACGTGEGTWELLELSAKTGLKPEQVTTEGWTLDPLEAWVAEKQVLPHELERGKNYKCRVSHLVEQGWGNRISFRAFNLLSERYDTTQFDLILCNGLLGGPIINQPEELLRVVRNLAAILTPDGLLLIADHFHSGWGKKDCRPAVERFLNEFGLDTDPAGEGIAAFRKHADNNSFKLLISGKTSLKTCLNTEQLRDREIKITKK